MEFFIKLLLVTFPLFLCNAAIIENNSNTLLGEAFFTKYANQFAKKFQTLQESVNQVYKSKAETESRLNDLEGRVESQLSNVTLIQDSVVKNLNRTMDVVEMFHPLAFFGNNFTCCDLRKAGEIRTGTYQIRVKGTLIKVRCDMDTEGGGWTVIQRRNLDGFGVNFTRGWKEYEEGFGKVPQSYWIGLTNIVELAKNSDQEIRFDMESFNLSKGKAYAKYGNFNISGPKDKYKLSIAKFSGTAGDSMEYHNGLQFSTVDNDNDVDTGKHCAQERKGGWWYKTCANANPNGILYSTQINEYNSIFWNNFYLTNSLKSMEMKIRNKNPSFCGIQ